MDIPPFHLLRVEFVAIIVVVSAKTVVDIYLLYNF